MQPRSGEHVQRQDGIWNVRLTPIKGAVYKLQNTRDGTVCILGLGYVGLTLATVMADVGFRIVGAEIREDIVKTLSDGKSHFHEPRLEQKSAG